MLGKEAAALRPLRHDGQPDRDPHARPRPGDEMLVARAGTRGRPRGRRHRGACRACRRACCAGERGCSSPDALEPWLRDPADDAPRPPAPGLHREHASASRAALIFPQERIGAIAALRARARPARCTWTAPGSGTPPSPAAAHPARIVRDVDSVSRLLLEGPGRAGRLGRRRRRRADRDAPAAAASCSAAACARPASSPPAPSTPSTTTSSAWPTTTATRAPWPRGSPAAAACGSIPRASRRTSCWRRPAGEHAGRALVAELAGGGRAVRRSQPPHRAFRDPSGCRRGGRFGRRGALAAACYSEDHED